MKNRLACLGFVLILVGANSLVISTPTTTTHSVEIAIFNYTYTWGACFYDDDNDAHGDFYSPRSFTMAILNNGTQKIVLEQVNLTFTMSIQNCVAIQSTRTLSNNTGIPLTLYPRYYWLTNITCDGGTTTTSVNIKISVDGSIIDYGRVVYMHIITPEYKQWAEWSEYQHYTKRSNLISINGGIFLVALLTVVVWSGKKPRPR